MSILIGAIAGGVSFLGYMGVSLLVFDKQLRIQKYDSLIAMVMLSCSSVLPRLPGR